MPAHVFGYIHIRTDTDTFVIAVNVRVVEGRIVPFPCLIDFGVITQSSAHSVRPFQLLNTHDVAVECVIVKHRLITADVAGQNLQIGPGSQANASVGFSAGADGHYQGTITVECRPVDLHSKNDQEYRLNVPYEARVRLGSLQYHVGALELVVNSNETLSHGYVEVTNNFSIPLLFLTAFILDPAFNVLQWCAQRLFPLFLLPSQCNYKSILLRMS